MGRLRVHEPLRRDELMPRIKTLRAQGHTQEEIAIEIGCATSTIQKWLKTEANKAVWQKTKAVNAELRKRYGRT